MITESAREGFRRRLERRWDELVGEVERTEEALAFLERSRPAELPEEGQEEAFALSLKSLDEMERRELEDVAAALRKLMAGGYGRCESCRREIPPERLEAHPSARLCLACKQGTEAG